MYSSLSFSARVCVCRRLFFLLLSFFFFVALINDDWIRLFASTTSSTYIWIYIYVHVYIFRTELDKIWALNYFISFIRSRFFSLFSFLRTCTYYLSLIYSSNPTIYQLFYKERWSISWQWREGRRKRSEVHFSFSIVIDLIFDYIRQLTRRFCNTLNNNIDDKTLTLAINNTKKESQKNGKKVGI